MLRKRREFRNFSINSYPPPKWVERNNCKKKLPVWTSSRTASSTDDKKKKRSAYSDLACSDFFELLDHLGWQSEEEEREDGNAMTTTPNQDAMCAVAIAGPIAQLVEHKNIFACMDAMQFKSVIIRSKLDAMFASFMESNP